MANEKKPMVFVVDDEIDLRETLEFHLNKAGFDTELFEDGFQVMRRIFDESARPDVLILDRTMPKCEGTVVAKRIRRSEANAEIPIIFLTARGTENDRIHGLEVGANDYVVKPFSTRELILRVKNLITKPVKQKLSFEGIVIDDEEHRVSIDGNDVPLTSLEYRLLTFFLERVKRVQSREALLVAVWNAAPDTATRAVDTTIKRLREKLGEKGRYIQTVRGVGYRLDAD